MLKPRPDPAAQAEAARLIAQIEASPAADGPWLSYARHLAEKGDPRAELIQRSQEAGFEAFVESQAARLFGEHAALVVRGGPIQLSYRMGMPSAVRGRFASADGAEILRRLRALMAAPLFRFVSELDFEVQGESALPPGLLEGVVRPLYAHNVRAVSVAAWTNAYRLHPAPLPRVELPFPGLERLGLVCANKDYGIPEGIAELALTAERLLPDDFQRMAGWSLPRLRSLTLTLLGTESRAEPGVLRMLFENTSGFPALERLRIVGCRFTDVLLDSMVGRPVIGRLKSLDLALCDCRTPENREAVERTTHALRCVPSYRPPALG